MQKLENDIFDDLGKVPSLNTCIELQEQGFAVQTEKAWYKDGFDNIELLTQSEYELSKSAWYANNRYKWVLICPAPDFAEICKKLPDNLFGKEVYETPKKYSDYGLLGFITNQNFIGYGYISFICLDVDTTSKTVAQSAAELYLKLKTKNLL